MKTIAVLMTCYNRVGTTLRCLRALFAQKLPEGYALEVWLVDDASPDGTGAKVKAEFPRVNVIQGNGKLFWCRGMRLAWDMAAAAKDYDFYLWLNDDVVLFPSALRVSIGDYEAASGDDRKAVIYGTFVEGPGSQSISYGQFRRGDRGGEVRPSGSPQEFDGLACGNFVLVPRAVYETVGKIYGGYWHGVGDTDYGLLLEERGCRKYVASVVLGWCPTNRSRFSLQEGCPPLCERLRHLWSKKGHNLHDTFVFRLRHWGIVRAVVSCAHVTLMMVLWRNVRHPKP